MKVDAAGVTAKDSVDVSPASRSDTFVQTRVCAPPVVVIVGSPALDGDVGAVYVAPTGSTYRNATLYSFVDDAFVAVSVTVVVDPARTLFVDVALRETDPVAASAGVGAAIAIATRSPPVMAATTLIASTRERRIRERRSMDRFRSGDDDALARPGNEPETPRRTRK
jgi:hypothetical protein